MLFPLLADLLGCAFTRSECSIPFMVLTHLLQVVVTSCQHAVDIKELSVEGIYAIYDATCYAFRLVIS